MSNDLKPRPSYGHYVYCENCAAQGPVITGEKVEPGENRWDKAREAWNARCEKDE